MNYIHMLFFLLFLSSIYSHDNKREGREDIRVVDESSGYFEKAKLKNPEAQEAVNQLKSDFHNEREKINQRYELKIKELKKNRRKDIKSLKERYKKRLKRLSKRYPEIPDIDIGAKPKPRLKPPRELEDSKKIRKKEKAKKIIKNPNLKESFNMKNEERNK